MSLSTARCVSLPERTPPRAYRALSTANNSTGAASEMKRRRSGSHPESAASAPVRFYPTPENTVTVPARDHRATPIDSVSLPDWLQQYTDELTADDLVDLTTAQPPAGYLDKGLWNDDQLAVRLREYRQAIARERWLRRRVESLANDLLDAAGELGYGSDDPFSNAVMWLEQAREDRPAVVRGAVKPKSNDRRYARHRKLHRIADTHHEGRWYCVHCGVGLVDVCADDDMVVTDSGRHLAESKDGLLPTIEHLVPTALGGTNDLVNLRLSCRPCNVQKGAQ